MNISQSRPAAAPLGARTAGSRSRGTGSRLRWYSDQTATRRAAGMVRTVTVLGMQKNLGRLLEQVDAKDDQYVVELAGRTLRAAGLAPILEGDRARARLSEDRSPPSLVEAAHHDVRRGPWRSGDRDCRGAPTLGDPRGP